MSYNYRELVESLDAIVNGEDNISTEVSTEVHGGSEQSCAALLKDITSSLLGVVEKLSGDDVNHAEIAEKLEKVRDILDEAGYNGGSEGDDTSTEEVEECYGTDGMAPKINSDGVQSYKQKDAPSYAARQGFVGI